MRARGRRRPLSLRSRWMPGTTISSVQAVCSTGWWALKATSADCARMGSAISALMVKLSNVLGSLPAARRKQMPPISSVQYAISVITAWPCGAVPPKIRAALCSSTNIHARNQALVCGPARRARGRNAPIKTSRAHRLGSSARFKGPSGKIRMPAIRNVHRRNPNATRIFRTLGLVPGEMGHLLLPMAFQSEIDEPIDQPGVGQAARSPQLWIHADRRKSRQRIDVIEVNFRRFAVLTRSHQEVDAGQTGAIAGPEGGQGHGADTFGVGHADFSGNDADAFVGAVELIFGFVIVKLLGGNDFADNAGFGSVIAEDGNLKLARLDSRAPDALLDHQLAIEAGGEVHRGSEIGAGFYLADADRGAEVRGLYEDGVGEGLFEKADALFGVGAPLGAQQGDVRRKGEAGGEEEALHGVFVHAGGRAENSGTDVSNVGKLEQALDGAVFAESAVEDGEDDVDGEGGGGVELAAGCKPT